MGNYAATAEELESRGSIVAASAARPQPFAALLAHLLSLAPSADNVPTLNPPPAWACWSHSGGGLWPPRTTAGEVEMNDYPEPSWLTNAASAARSRLHAHHLADVVGHCDWESQNIRWSNSKAVVVHDWDSACTLPEAAIVGIAAAIFPATGGDEAATVDQSEEFIATYLTATGRPWSAEEHSVAWAAGLWALAYNAKGCFIGSDGGPVADRLETESEQRLARLDRR